MQWPLTKKIAFRFLFLYLVLYCVHVNLPPGWLGNRLAPGVGKLLGVDATLPTRMGGSGDTTYHYVQVLCLLLLALTGALLWSVVDRKRDGYHRLYLGLRVFVRIALGITLIGYGMAKVIQTQFPPIALHRLVQPFGDASPMGLLWTFMGASTTYNIFTGGAEVLGGALLFFRRTTLLGALLSIGVLSHVCVLNFSYDVPVKLYSLHLLGMAIFLVAGEADRMASFFVFNRAAQPASRETVIQRPGLLRGAFILKLVVLTAVIGGKFFSGRAQSKMMGLTGPKPPLYGIWETEEFAMDGRELAPLLSDSNRWRRLIIGYSRQISFIQGMDDKRTAFGLRVDLPAKKLFLTEEEFKFAQPDDQTLVLDGRFRGRAIRARLRRVDETEFLLINRGFHWINESPYNR